MGRVVAVLEHLVNAPQGAGLAELAQATGAPKTSLVGLLQALVHERCLQRQASGKYVLGERIRALALRSSAGQDLISLARPFLEDLVRLTSETAILGVLATDEDLAVYIDKVEGTHPLRYTVPVGERRELHCTAMGMALLAHAPHERTQAFLKARSYPRFTAKTLTTPKALAAELEAVRERGIARSTNQRIDGLAACAAPVFGASGQAVAALLVAGPAERFLASRNEIEKHLVDRAQAMSRLLGANPTATDSSKGRPHAKH